VPASVGLKENIATATIVCVVELGGRRPTTEGTTVTLVSMVPMVATPKLQALAEAADAHAAAAEAEAAA